jgi:D-alanyl-D-alanine carboxypeptidase/D-alanyl-D-alanine-endopeptidase (penicillin-binding protein 4)
MAAVVAALAGSAALGGYAGVRQLREPSPVSPPPPRDRALVEAARASSPPPSTDAPRATASGVAAALRAPLGDPHLGRRVLAEVRDVASGGVLLSREGSSPAAPASTAKLVTAVAVLGVRRSTDRILTRVVAGARPGTVVLVGGGDPTLTGAAPGRPGAYPGAARISDLAARLRGVPVRRIDVDGSLFTGAGVSQYWAPDDVPSGYAAPIVATMVDGGRDAPAARIRSTAPDLAAGRALAAALHLPAAAVSRAEAPAAGRVLASVRSAPIGTLVTQMLQASDNVIAECLARQVAVAEHQPASFAGAALAVRIALRQLALPIASGLVDGSGLAARDRLSPDTLTRVLTLATGRPRLRGVLDALPVAGWSGTLAGRYLSGSARAGAGLVRAKTGTLTSVSTLAGLVQDRDGRLLAFAVMADRVGPSGADTEAAEAALDAVAARLAACGC